MHSQWFSAQISPVQSGSIRFLTQVGLIGLLCLCLALAISNKIFPWTSLWNEILAALGLVALGVAVLATDTLTGRHHSSLSHPLAFFLVLGVVSVWVQHATGLLDRASDAWLVTLYLSLLTLAVVIGHRLAGVDEDAQWLRALLLALLAAGLISTSIALVQWLWASPPIVFIQEMESGDRPYANLGQPNHASTLFFLALCAALQLQRDRVIGVFGTLLAITLLTFAMVLTQSRTGVLQWGLLLAYGLWIRPKGEAAAWRWGALVLALGLLFWAVLPWMYEVLLLPGSARAMTESGSSGRLAIWQAFWDAVWMRPWTGWGWLQTGWAQQAVAACHPGMVVYFSYTHLLPLDFILWLGLPLGLLMCALLVWWLGSYLTPTRSAQAGFWLVAVLGFGIHSLLEYPQAYLYFLLPVGLMIGVIEARVPVHRTLAIPAPVFGLLWLAAAVLAAVVFWDALRASNAYTEVRFVEARIGKRSAPPEVPQLLVLDQLQALVQLRATEVDQVPSAATLELARRVARRQPLRWVSMRYAQLLALAGQGEEAAREQQRLCDINGERQCAQWGRMWEEWRRTRAPRELSIPAFQGQVLGPRCESITKST